MENNKKTVIFLSNYPLLKSGLGRNGRAVAEHLYKTDKYNLIYYAQGVLYDNPEYTKFPYKVVGCLPNNQQELDNINKDGNYARFAAYGGHMIDKIIQDFRPDILILSDDIWSFPFTEKPWFNKFPCVYHITVDSTPVLPEAFKQAAKTPYYFTWSDFANQEFYDRGLNHVKSIPGAIDQKDFYKLSGYEKLELRRKFNIPENSFICGFVFRNQLRKELGPLIEGYGIWKKQNPGIKNTYLFLHTHFTEPAGWDIPRLCETYNVNKDEILTTYICRNCLEINVKKFEGQDLDCQFCKSKGSAPTKENPVGSGLITCNIGFGCTEFQLNQVYNLMDCYCHLMNAGGLEIPIVEALYCEIPTATVPYSSGETFTKNNFVFEIGCSWTVQIGTQFKRACPYPSSVAKFLDQIYKTDIKKRQEIGRESRKWALSKFAPEIVGKQWEDVIDSIPAHNYDFNFQQELKNPNFPIPEIENNEEFIVSLYSNILKCQPDENGKKNWLNGLKNGQSRQQVYEFFIDLAKKDNNQKQTVSLESLFPRIDGKKNVCLILPQSIGDLVILSALLPSVYKKYPLESHTIYLAAEPKYFEIFEGNENIKLVPFNPIMRQEMILIGAGGNGCVDHFVDVSASAQIHLNYLTNKY